MNTIKSIVRDIVIVAGLSAVVVFAQSWSGPTATPPGNNTSAPINVSSDFQEKFGELWVGVLGASGGATIGGNVGIGTTNPGAKLEVVGQIKITGGTPGSGKVLTSNASGLASWMTMATGNVTGTGTSGNLTQWTGSNTISNYAGSSTCSVGQFVTKINANGTISCTAASKGTLSCTTRYDPASSENGDALCARYGQSCVNSSRNGKCDELYPTWVRCCNVQ